MMVSTATAVLPVWRSPMISSRWPRPIGTIESIALSPVCTGCATDWRQITPGATFSITSVSFASIGPLPSIGSPSAFTTRPINSRPTGTSRMRPVVFTVSPSVMCSILAQHHRADRIALKVQRQPERVVRKLQHLALHHVGQPVDAADPVGHRNHGALRARFERAAQVLNATLDELADLGWVQLHVMTPSRCLVRERHRHRFKPPAYRRVDHLVAHDDAHPANQLRLDLDLRIDLAAILAFERAPVTAAPALLRSAAPR